MTDKDQFDLKDAEAYHKESVDSIVEWCDSIYNKEFATTFKKVREIASRMESRSLPITDEELEWIITNLPMKLFEVSEDLSTLQLKREVIKLQTKKKESDIFDCCNQNSDARRKEAAAYFTIGDKLLIMAYDSVISRVEREISYSKELIMGAKKVWDARRRTDASNPISDVVVDTELPEYDPHSTGSKTYIHG